MINNLTIGIVPGRYYHPNLTQTFIHNLVNQYFLRLLKLKQKFDCSYSNVEFLH